MTGEAYINGMGIVSPQNTFGTDDFLSAAVEYNTNSLRCVEPSYKDLLNPALARRMGRVIKMSIAASSACLKDAGIVSPDAIMTGTALGCHEDTEKFLMNILDNDEQFLTPTSFIQSTHNTVSAQIALQLKCMNYNFTYVHKGFSFESAVLDGLMTLDEGEAKNVLVGGHDEMTDKHFLITGRIGYWKKETMPTMELVNSTTNGTIAGEGASFFVLSHQKGPRSYAKLKGLKMLYKPGTPKDIEKEISAFLEEKGLTPADLDVVIYGLNGDVRFDGIYHELKEGLLKNSVPAYYKHLCGEYQTSSGFAFWAAARIVQTQRVPECMQWGQKPEKPIRNVLVYNHFMNEDHALFLLSPC
jgi:3-oxoacyl-[acyl-carrier-protein] synthase II